MASVSRRLMTVPGRCGRGHVGIAIVIGGIGRFHLTSRFLGWFLRMPIDLAEEVVAQNRLFVEEQDAHVQLTL